MNNLMISNKLIIIAVAVIAVVGVGFFAYDGNKKYNDTLSRMQEKVYVALEGSGEIAVIDAVTKKLFKKIDLSEIQNGKRIGYMPHNVQVAPDNKSVWVTTAATEKMRKMSFQIIPAAHADEGPVRETVDADDQIIVIDPSSDKITKRINLGRGLRLSHVALTPDGLFAITASQEKGVIYKINTISFEVEKTVDAQKGAGPHGLRISPDGKTAYIAMLGGKSMGILQIEKMNLEYIPLKGSAVQTGVTPDGKHALASVYETKGLAVYEIASGTLRYVDLPKEAKGPVQLYPTADSRFVFVADQGYYFDQPTSNLVYKIDIREMKVVQTIPAGSAPHGIVVSQDGELVYVTNLLSDDVSVINVQSGQEEKRIKVGDMPNGISIWSTKASGTP